MDELLTSIDAKKRLDELRPLSWKALANLEHYYDIELTYTSNAIEGNTLSAVETTLVIEKGITVSGKPLKDHLEALDHYDTIRYVRELARQETPITGGDVRNLHKLVMQRPPRRLPDNMLTCPAMSVQKPDATAFHHRQRFRRSWGISQAGLQPRRTRRTRHSPGIAALSIFTRSMTVTDARRGF